MRALAALRRQLWPKSLGGKFVFASAFSLVLVIGLWFAASRTTERRLAAAVEKCRELGYSEERRPTAPSIPDGLNGAVPFEKACDLAHDAIEEVTKQLSKSSDDRPAGIQADAGKRLARDSEYERLLKEANERSGFQSSIDAAAPSSVVWWTFTDHLNDLIDVETQMASELASAGNQVKAVDRLLRVLRLLQKRAANDPKMGFVPRYFSQRWALEELNIILRERALPDESHDRIEAELRTHDIFAGELWPALEQRQFNDLIGLKTQSLLHTTFLFKPLANIDEAFAFERLELALASRIMTHKEWRKQPFETHPLAGLPFLKQEWHMHQGVLQVTTFARTNGGNFRARLRALRILNAMARLKNFNAKLESLGLSAECLVDPFDGRPMRIVDDERGLRVYSVGSNGQDDQGLFDAPLQIWDAGFGPAKAMKQ